jgi:hypothetical protein
MMQLLIYKAQLSRKQLLKQGLPHPEVQPPSLEENQVLIYCPSIVSGQDAS